MKDSKFLPSSQHGFRKHWSTMTAWANIQKEWANKTYNKQSTGVLLWDLSVEFDRLDSNILCDKIFGFSKLTINWITSFLKNRIQRVKTERNISPMAKLVSGVLQGGNNLTFTVHHVCVRSKLMAEIYESNYKCPWYKHKCLTSTSIRNQKNAGNRCHKCSEVHG